MLVVSIDSLFPLLEISKDNRNVSAEIVFYYSLPGHVFPDDCSETYF